MGGLVGVGGGMRTSPPSAMLLVDRLVLSGVVGGGLAGRAMCDGLGVFSASLVGFPSGVATSINSLEVI